MAYEILVLDIDGTLTNSEKKISKDTLRAVLETQERGHKVVLASGRPTPGIIPVADQIRLKDFGGYILSYNGAKITNYGTGEVIYQKTLPKDVIPKLYEAAVEFGVGIITYEDQAVVVGTKIDSYMEIEARINQMPLKEVDNFSEYVDFDVNKCLMTGEPSHLAKVEEIMKERFGSFLSIFRSEPFFLEIVPQNVDKADSLSHLLDALNLSKTQMISCGDGFNDLTMIEYAGMGVAMANAQQVVKDAADYITLSNDEDGVAHVIDQFLLQA